VDLHSNGCFSVKITTLKTMLHLELMVGGLRVEAAHRLASVQVILYTLTTNYVFCVCIYSEKEKWILNYTLYSNPHR